MNPRPTILPHYPLLSSFTPRSFVPPRGLRPATTVPGRDHPPAVLWRESLSVFTDRLTRFEGWAFLALAALTLPAAAFSQSVLWRLIDGGALTRTVRTFLISGNL